MKRSLRQRLAQVRLVVFDVDGTLTNGTIYLGENEELKGYHTSDGLGIRLLLKAGIHVAFVTGRRSGSVSRRARELGVRYCLQAVRDKRECLERLTAKLKLSIDEVAAMGDDLPDFELFAAAGVKLCVADAAEELRTAADWVSTRAGGCGAAREAAENILKAQGNWRGLARAFGGAQES